MTDLNPCKYICVALVFSAAACLPTAAAVCRCVLCVCCFVGVVRCRCGLPALFAAVCFLALLPAACLRLVSVGCVCVLLAGLQKCCTLFGRAGSLPTMAAVISGPAHRGLAHWALARAATQLGPFEYHSKSPHNFLDQS